MGKCATFNPLRSGELKRNMPRIIDFQFGNFHKIHSFPPSRWWNRSHGGWPGEPGKAGPAGPFGKRVCFNGTFKGRAPNLLPRLRKWWFLRVKSIGWNGAQPIFGQIQQTNRKFGNPRAPFISNPLVWEVVPIGFGRFTWLGLAENPNEISWIQQIRVRDPNMNIDSILNRASKVQSDI